MGFNLFRWLRHKAREAFLGGITDAVEEIESGADPGKPFDQAAFAARLSEAVKRLPPAPTVTETDEADQPRSKKERGGAR